MKSKKSIKAGLSFLTTILFIISSFNLMVFGYNGKSTEIDEYLKKLNFVCSYDNDYSRFDYYKEYKLFEADFNDDIVIDVLESENILVKISFISPLFSNGPMNSSWSMQSHDTHHTGKSPYSTVYSRDEIWRFETEGWIDDTPVIDNDGVIYFGGRYGGLPYYLYAIYPDGTFNWRYKTDGLISGSSPAISDDGTIYVGSWDTKLYAINLDGTLKWKIDSGGSIASSPAIADDGTIYFGTLSSGNSIVAINPNGTKKWSYKTGYSVTSDPAIGNDGTIYCGSGDSYLYALYPNGTLRWRFKTDDEIHGHPSIANDGTIYIGSWDDYLYALNPDGTMKWKVGTGWGTSNSQAIGEDGTIYVGTNRLYAFYPNGTLKWKLNLGTDRYVGKSSPAVCADGIIYVGLHCGEGAGGEIIAVNPNGIERWRKKIADEWVDSSPSIGEDGTVYVGSASLVSGQGFGFIHAFGIGDLEADANGPYYGLINEPVYFAGSATGGYRPHSYLWDFGDTYTSEEQNPTHTYISTGNYTVTLTVTDNSSNTSSDTTFAWIQDGNTPPDTPDIDGPSLGNPGISYDYKFTGTDPDGSVIYLFVDWDDGSNSGWLGPYDSGQKITLSHKWSQRRTFMIKCKAKDPYGAESDLAEFEITIPRHRASYSSLFQWFSQRFPLLSRLFYFL